MLRTYFLISRRLDVLQAINNLKILQIVLLCLIMAIETSSFNKHISLLLLIVTFSFVIYIVVSEFLRIKGLHDDLKLACRIPTEEA